MSLKQNSIIKVVFSVLIILSMMSCTPVASVLNLDSDLQLNITAKEDINPDDTETPSPLVLRLYELKDKKKFEELAFFDIYQNDKKLLGKHMVEKHTLKHFIPDTKRKQQFVLDKKTRYIALFAEFSQYKDSDFKAIVEIDPHFDRKVDIILTGTVIQIHHDKRDPFFEVDPDEDFKNDMEDAKGATDALSGLK